jgi:hypothetical protein
VAFDKLLPANLAERPDMVILFYDGVWVLIVPWFWFGLVRAALLAMTAIGHNRR